MASAKKYIERDLIPKLQQFQEEHTREYLAITQKEEGATDEEMQAACFEYGCAAAFGAVITELMEFAAKNKTGLILPERYH